jgi:hypothetical protein
MNSWNLRNPEKLPDYRGRTDGLCCIAKLYPYRGGVAVERAVQRDGVVTRSIRVCASLTGVLKS